MAGDYGKFKVGSIVYPLDPLLISNPLQASNPAIFEALDFFTAMLQLKTGAYWDALVAQQGRSEFIGKVVNYQLPYDPLPYFKQQQAKFPLLAIWKTKSFPEPKTFSWYHTKAIWKICYSLFPTTPSEAESIQPFLEHAFNVINDRAEQGYDPDYFNKKQVWSDGYGGVGKLQITDCLFQSLQFDPKSNLFFPTMLMTAEVSFREEFLRSFLNPLEGVNVQQNLNSNEPPIDNFVDFQVNV